MRAGFMMELEWECVPLQRPMAEPTTNYLSMSDDHEVLWELTELALTKIDLVHNTVETRPHRPVHCMSKVLRSNAQPIHTALRLVLVTPSIRLVAWVTTQQNRMG